VQCSDLSDHFGVLRGEHHFFGVVGASSANATQIKIRNGADTGDDVRPMDRFLIFAELIFYAALNICG